MKETLSEDLKISVYILVIYTYTEAHQQLSTAASLGYMDRPGLELLLIVRSFNLTKENSNKHLDGMKLPSPTGISSKVTWSDVVLYQSDGISTYTFIQIPFCFGTILQNISCFILCFLRTKR